MDPAGTQKVEGDPFLIYMRPGKGEAGYSGAENSNLAGIAQGGSVTAHRMSALPKGKKTLIYSTDAFLTLCTCQPISGWPPDAHCFTDH